MAATVRIDHISTLEAEEKFGILQRLVRVAHVKGLEETDYLVLMEALDATDLPKEGDGLDGDRNLILTGRVVRVIDKSKCEVTLTYEHFMNEGQSFNNCLARGRQFCGELRANIQQVQTNKDKNGAMVTVSHTYPSSDPDYGGQTKTQTGELQRFVSQKTVTYTGILDTNTPWETCNALIGKVNLASWQLGAARTWMCTAASWKMADIGDTGDIMRFFFTFEFQHNPDTWDPTAIFIDDRSGKPPADLVENVGYRTIEYETGVDFDALIGLDDGSLL